MKTFYFTATGNCLHAAKQIGGTLISIPRVLKQAITSFEDDKMVIVVPCYYFETPRIVQKLINRTLLIPIIKSLSFHINIT